MIIQEKFVCIGLFGTCGNSTFRQEKFIPEFEKLNIPYFNPQVEDWSPALAIVEAEHLANDRVVMFPITSETYGLGSLSEVGLSLLNAIKLDDRRYFIVMIDDKLDDELMKDKVLSKESLRNRALVKQHLLKLNFSNVFLVETLDQMLEAGKLLYKNAYIEYLLKKSC